MRIRRLLVQERGHLLPERRHLHGLQRRRRRRLRGPVARLDYLHALGVTCVWLQPFYCSPNRDNGYDVSDFYGVTPRFGSAGDFVECMNHAHALGIRVVADLVANHTSIDHPWFQSARSDPESPYRDQVWADKPRAGTRRARCSLPMQSTTWTRDKKAAASTSTASTSTSPTSTPTIRPSARSSTRSWASGCSSAPRAFAWTRCPLVERKGETSGEGLRAARGDAPLPAVRARRDPARRGERSAAREPALLRRRGRSPADDAQLPANQRLYYAFATGDPQPLKHAIRETLANVPRDAQWVQFLRSHDELDLGWLTDAQRKRVFEVLRASSRTCSSTTAASAALAPMLGNDRRRLELAYSLLFSLPGTPMIQYGDEIGMGEDLRSRSARRRARRCNGPTSRTAASPRRRNRCCRWSTAASSATRRSTSTRSRDRAPS